MNREVKTVRISCYVPERVAQALENLLDRDYGNTKGDVITRALLEAQTRHIPASRKPTGALVWRRVRKLKPGSQPVLQVQEEQA